MAENGGSLRVRWDVFISYAAVDQPWAEWIASQLEAEGLRVLIQAWDFVPGTSWPRLVNEGLRDGARLVAVTSPEYLRSIEGSAVWQAAWASDVDGEDRRLVPVIVRPCDSRSLGLLAARRAIDLTELSGPEDDEQARLLLLDGLHAAHSGRIKPSGATSLPERRAGQPAGAAVSTAPGLPSRYVPRPDLVNRGVAHLVDTAGPSVVGLVGMGGAGKSTIAKAMVADPRVRAAFPDGVVWLDVGAQPDPVILLAQVAAAVGDFEPITDTAAGAVRLRARLAARHCLIVADNVWHPDDLRVLPTEGSARLLVTTRTADALFLDSAVVGVELADPVISRAVLARHAGVAVEELPPEADEILDRCGGLVLALALAGGMAARGRRRWGYIAERLRHAHHERLAGRFGGYLYPHLLAALEASLETLSDDERRRYAELAVFENQGAVPVDVVCALWSTTAAMGDLDAEDLLLSFVDRSLVSRSPATSTISVHDLLLDRILSTAAPEDLSTLHRSLADRLLRDSGGIPSGLPQLLAVSASSTLSSSLRHYIRHALVGHLIDGGDDETAEALLASRHTTRSGRVGNAWFAVHEEAGGTTNFLADVRAVWARAAARTNREVGGDESGSDSLDGLWPPRSSSLATEIRCALTYASVVDLASNAPPVLLERLVAEGLWSPQRALGYANAHPEERGSAETIGLLAPHLSDELLRGALASARACSSPRARVTALAGIAPRLPDDDRDTVLSEALDAVPDVVEFFQHEALEQLAPLLPARLLPRAVELVHATTMPHTRGNLLAALAPYLPDHLLADALTAVRANLTARRDATRTGRPTSQNLAGPGDDDRNDPVEDEFGDEFGDPFDDWHEQQDPWYEEYDDGHGEEPEDPFDDRSEGRFGDDDEDTDNPLDTDDPWDTDKPLNADDPLDERSFARPNPWARKFEDNPPPDQLQMLGVLAPHLPVDLLGKALDLFGSATGDDQRRRELERLAPHLPVTLLTKALLIVATLRTPADQAGALSALAPHLPSDLASSALDIACQISDETTRSRALTALAPHLPDSLVPTVLDAATAMGTPANGAPVLVALAPRLSASMTAKILRLARTLPAPLSRAQCLVGLMPLVPARQRDEVLDETLRAVNATVWPTQVANLLAALPQSSGSHLYPQVLRNALHVAQRSSWTKARSEEVVALAPLLPDGLLAEALDVVRTIPSSEDRLAAIAGLAPWLPAAMLPAALDVACASPQPGGHVEALIRVAPHASSDQRSRALSRALRTLAVAESFKQPRLAAQMGPQLPPDLFPLALDVVGQMPQPRVRARALAGLAPHVPVGLLPSALAVARAIKPPHEQAMALAALLPLLPDEPLAEALELAQATAKAMAPPHGHGHIDIAACLGPSGRERLLRAVLDLIRDMVDHNDKVEIPHDQAHALDNVLQWLPDDLLPGAVDITRNNPNVHAQAIALVALAPRLTAHLVPEALGIARQLTAESRAQALAGLAPYADPRDRTLVLIETLQAVRDTQWTTEVPRIFCGIAAHLPSELLGPALTIAETLLSQNERVAALVALMPYLPDELRERALTNAKKLADEVDYATALAGMAPHLPGFTTSDVLHVASDIARESRQSNVGRAAAALSIVETAMKSHDGSTVRHLRNAFLTATSAGRKAVLDVIPSAFRCLSEGSRTRAADALLDVLDCWP